jgi:hypothetical protein
MSYLLEIHQPGSRPASQGNFKVTASTGFSILLAGQA